MSGRDRRSAAACPCSAARESLYTPVHVVELDLDRPNELRSPGGASPVVPNGRVLALVRLHGHPLGLVHATGRPGDTAGLCRALVAAAHRELELPSPELSAPDLPAARTEPNLTPLLSVVVATHNRPASLRRCLDSLLRTGYPQLDVVVVDNAPADDSARTLVLTEYPPSVRYLREPIPGLARAHNRGLAAAHGTLVAFTDDDTVVDRGWPRALVATFAADPAVGCVTGLIVPAELETQAQVALENHGGYTKGFTEQRWSLDAPPDEPLFPFAGGQFGSGANMAFRADLLHRLGGFDPATGTGTLARGGDDLLAFFRTLIAGAALVYQPDAIVWHHHHRTMDALPAQAYGYGVGFGAYLTAAVAHEPAMLPALLRRVPLGLGQAVRRARSRPAPTGPGAGRQTHGRLTGLELRGLAYGPLGYLRSCLRARRDGIPHIAARLPSGAASGAQSGSQSAPASGPVSGPVSGHASGPTNGPMSGPPYGR
ncbi:glycosyltransferase family 2 protein [Streptacidiphilus fuscans]|uniref:glycosyltransferase family 2 protein n=1 Tax=Streptacidiphilus fuscans TaxID=2789292 RepID=UPI001F15CD95|nr:glycosyltransferase [Streptacidiphilus fuscans]